MSVKGANPLLPGEGRAGVVFDGAPFRPEIEAQQLSAVKTCALVVYASSAGLS